MSIPDPLGASLTTLVSHNITINDFLTFPSPLFHGWMSASEWTGTQNVKICSKGSFKRKTEWP